MKLFHLLITLIYFDWIYITRSEISDKNLLKDNVDAIAKIIYKFAYSTSTKNITNNLSSISSNSS